MISLIIAGGVYVAATSQTTATQWPDIDNHTLRGEAIPASQVVCRNMWGTPMLPDGKGGYSLIAPINQDYIQQSLIIPPVTTQMVAYRPLPPAVPEAVTPTTEISMTTSSPTAPPEPSAPMEADPSVPAESVEPAGFDAAPPAVPAEPAPDAAADPFAAPVEAN